MYIEDKNASLLNLVIQNAESILKSPTNSLTNDMFWGWYEQAENALEIVFGDKWKAFVTWESYRSEIATSLDIKRLERAVAQIRSAMTLIGDVPTATPIKKQNNQAVPRSYYQQQRRIYLSYTATTMR